MSWKESPLVQEFRKQNVCYPCCLRLSKVDWGEPYTQALLVCKHLTKSLYIALQEPQTRLCHVCLGILHNVHSIAFRELLEAKLKELEFGDALLEVQSSIAIPSSVIIREREVWMHIQRHHPDAWSEEVYPSIRKAAIHILQKNLSHILPKKGNGIISLELEIVFTPGDVAQELSIMAAVEPNLGRRRKVQRCGRDRNVMGEESIVLGMVRRALRVFPQGQQVAISKVVEPCHHTERWIGPSIYLAGRYNKWKRGISQTPWLRGKEPPCDSVEFLLCPSMVKATFAQEARFQAAGREDKDVRMLGNGRPFVVELVAPRVLRPLASSIHALEESINAANVDKIAVRCLQSVSKSDVGKMKEGEQSKKKEYSALVWTERSMKKEEVEVLFQKDVDIQQETPLRVMHRRALLFRPRRIYHLSAEWIDEHWIRVEMTTQAGTYVKEFISGDRGRSVPSIASLLKTPALCVELDVTGVDLDFPKCE